MKYYYQAGKSLKDQELILVHGEYLMHLGEITKALEIFHKTAQIMERDLGRASYHTLSFHWKMGEIHLNQGNLDKALGFFL
jgi:tetratricopeptide (TPR) repeat protein